MLGKGKIGSEYAQMKINTIIGADIVVEGKLKATETTRIDGVIRGEVSSEGTFVIGKTGKVIGNIEAANVMISGTVQGDLKVSGKIEAASTAKIYGDITTKSLIIDEDAIFQGTCSMSGVAVTEEDTRPTAFVTIEEEEV